MAARIQKELSTEVEMIHGRYGEFDILVDGQTVLSGGALGIFGVLPSSQRIVETVRSRLVLP